MLLLRTVCYTDWKGRPSHSVTLVAKTEGRKYAIEAMDQDVAKWMATDIAASEWCELEMEGVEPEAGSDTAREVELLATKTPSELKDMWMAASAGNRWEMDLPDSDHREFVERCDDSEFSTTVYHLLTDNHEYTDRK